MVTDVSEFNYRAGDVEHKGRVYLSVILDLCDQRPVSYIHSHNNDNPLVFDTFDKLIEVNPSATPLFHYERGCQYTSKEFRQKIVKAGMTQSMSRVVREGIEISECSDADGIP